MKDMKKIGLGGLFICFLALTIYLVFSEVFMYAILTGTISLVLLILFVMDVFSSKDEYSIYNSVLNNIVKTYDAVLINSDNVPEIDGRNIIMVNSIEDLIDAQAEIRKPIYYKKEFDSCSFVLLDDKEVCIFILKVNDTIVSPLEAVLYEIKANKSKKNDDSKLLDGIDKTTIIKLENNKSFRVSPIRDKEKKSEKEISDQELLGLLKEEYMPKLKK
ncbi:MAG: hypothetical protein IJ475_01755 [Bacilli bacterium]|nr:hypothetical protein [Bacilli bacterium]